MNIDECLSAEASDALKPSEVGHAIQAADFWANMRWSVLLCEVRMDEIDVF